MELVIIGAGGEESRVRIERAKGGYSVEIDGRSFELDVRSSASERSLLIDGRQWEVSVERESDGRYIVGSSAGEETVEVRDPLAHLARDAAAGSGLGGSRSVAAYMPGRVATILVEEGAAVEAGQGVVVLEAMKMENEIQSEVGGVVTKIFVEPGQAVEGGDPLFEIEPS